ncbi:fatty acid desaturase family protein [Stylonychia lemnae]|uniref:Fatty acid desaturase family protein n=1 Tax=Stylonychia lemnae TaxID=5949 RepID=A0A078AFH3_STYLE|nr:fatty acid desaturase family protein [Stylonychia lemnae]|eukprot:CDW80586.1 fatty acid desaturase family protein [Stylonychia lemnae]
MQDVQVDPAEQSEASTYNEVNQSLIKNQNEIYKSNSQNTFTQKKDVALQIDDTPPSIIDLIPFYSPLGLLCLMYCSDIYYQNPFIIIWVGFVAIPILDYILPVDHYNIPENRLKAFERDWRFMVPVYLAWFADIGIYFSILYSVSIGQVAQTPASFIIYAISYAQPGAANAIVGHELIHRKEKIHKIFGTLSYSKMLYSHFLIQHIVSHHKKVATPEDPSSARMNESLYEFYWRAIPAGYVEVWNIEKIRLQREDSSPFNPLKNRILLFNILHIVYLGLIYIILGLHTVCFHLVYSLIVTLMFEAVNYLEHYGLQRKKDSNGNYESVSIKHSWNAPQKITNWITFKLQRHSDHHAYAYKPYQILDSFPESPMLPYGYTVSLILSNFPYIWKKVHNPLADATNNDTKISEELKKELDKWILGTLIGVSIMLSYITFFMIGFKEA